MKSLAMKSLGLFALLAFLAVASRPAAAQQIQLEPVIPGGLSLPIGVTHAGDSSGRLFLTLQGGRIVIFNGTSLLPTSFLDLSHLVSCCGEQGLLGIAFHPQYATNGYVYVNYTDTAGNTVIARYRVSANPNLADPASALTLLTIAQPYANHNGGQLHFGPDGYLYIGMGDGGSAGDPGNVAQNLGSLLGKMLRIDVNGGSPYAIPPGNPFAGVAGARPEIWAYGLRNTWAFSFDRLTGDLWMGDVGQDAREEIDFQPTSSQGGENYGWRRMEGSLCYNPASNCNDGTLKLPLFEYDHTLGCSVTGGLRYRGSVYPSLYGKYFYGDFCSGRIWAGTQNGAAWSSAQLLDSPYSISSFGEDQAGELYLTHYSQANGAVYRIKGVAAPGGEIIVDNLPAGQQDAQRSFSGVWCASTGPNPYGGGSLYSCGGGADKYRFIPPLINAGLFDVYVRWTAHPNRSAAVPITVTHASGATTRQFNQKSNGGVWVLHGRYSFAAGSGQIEVSDGNGQAGADAVRLVPATGMTSARLTVGVSGRGSGTVVSNPSGINCGADCVQDYAVGTVVQMTATPAVGSVFTEWGGPCAGNGACGITMNDAKFVTANFSLETIVNNASAGVQDPAGGRTFIGTWCVSSAPSPYGAGSLYSCGAGADTYRFTPNVPEATSYDVYVRWTASPNRASAVPIAVTHSGGTTTRQFNQKLNGGQWVLHGRYEFVAGRAGYIEVKDSNGQACADAVKLVSAR